jgi:hypothetical protein
LAQAFRLAPFFFLEGLFFRNVFSGGMAFAGDQDGLRF